MPLPKPSVIRVAMAKRVAEKWIEDNAHPEYRITAYFGQSSPPNLPGMLKAFRDGGIRLGSIPPIPDLGVKAGFDQIVLWSKDRAAMVALDSWLTKRGCETSGIW